MWLISKEIGEPSGNKGVDWAAQWSVQPTKMYSVHHCCCTRSPEHQSTAEHQSTTTDQSRWREGCIVIERNQLKWPRPTYSRAQSTVLQLHILYCHRKSQKLGEHRLFVVLTWFILPLKVGVCEIYMQDTNIWFTDILFTEKGWKNENSWSASVEDKWRGDCVTCPEETGLTAAHFRWFEIWGVLPLSLSHIALVLASSSLHQHH